MRVLVIGAGEVGARVLRQLQKNTRLEIFTVDPRKNPPAVQEGVVDSVDFSQSLTSRSLQSVIDEVQPDLVLVTTAAEDLGFGRAPGIEVLVESLRDELASASKVPVIAVSRLITR